MSKRTKPKKPEPSALRRYLTVDGVRIQTIADALNIDRTTLWRWSANGVPVNRVTAVSAVTGLSPPVLRPDLAEAFAA